ncbi:hypothetical protein BGX21_002906 [Mortierella sp. AD011]|nr:hypothetical protein BGX20_003361 [Mortierella sp. AD010]KAF9378445.1 hypothetical protein BGX21_002906 [Mortierella sp. AD011]
MTELLMKYVEKYLVINQTCEDLAAKIAMNRVFYLDPGSTLQKHLGQSGEFLFTPFRLPKLSQKDVMDIYDVCNVFEGGGTKTFPPSRTRSQAFDLTLTGIRTDLHFEYQGLFPLVCECKKLGTDTKFDFEKLTLELKDSLDAIISDGWKPCEVFGILVSDDHGEVFVAELKAESIYFMWKLGTLVRPKDHTEMLYTLLNNMPILLDLDLRMTSTLDALVKRSEKDIKCWPRPSFELPRQ